MALSPQPAISSSAAHAVARMSTMPVGNSRAIPSPTVATRLISTGSLTATVAGGASSHFTATRAESSPFSSIRGGSAQLPVATGMSTRLPFGAGPSQLPIARPESQLKGLGGGSIQLPVTPGVSTTRQPFAAGSCTLPVASTVQAPSSQSSPPHAQVGRVTPKADDRRSASREPAPALHIPSSQSSSLTTNPHVQVGQVTPKAEDQGSASHDPASLTARSRTQSPQTNRPSAPPASFKMQLNDVRRTLEEMPVSFSQRTGAVLQNHLPVDEQRITQKLEQLIQVQQVQKADIVALERKIQECTAKEASQQAEQRLFLRTLRDEIIVLQQQVQSLHEGGGEPLPTAAEEEQPEVGSSTTTLRERTNSNMDVTIRQLRLDFDSKISEQGEQLKCWHAEVLQRLAKCVEDSLAQHGELITAVVSEVKSLRLLQGEKELRLLQDDKGMPDISALETRLTSSYQEDQQGDGSKPFQTVLAGTGVTGRTLSSKPEEEGMEAIRKSRALLTKTQQDLSSLRELLNKSTTQKDQTSQQRYLGMIKCLEAEEADLREVHSLLQQQHEIQDSVTTEQITTREGLEVEAVQQKPQDGTLGFAQTAMSEARETDPQGQERVPEYFQTRMLGAGKLIQLANTSAGNPSSGVPSVPGGYPTELSAWKIKAQDIAK